MLRNCAVIIFIAVVLTSAMVFAGETYEEIPGNTVIPIQQNDIRLEKEVVRVDDDVVKAIFAFENTASREINFQMGFPFTRDTEPPLKSKIGGTVGANEKNFIVRVDGKALPVNKGKITDDIKLKVGPEYDFMYTWSITFKPKEKKVIECLYNVQWSIEPESYPDGSSFRYITKTGALWKGTITKAEFHIKLNDHISQWLKQERIKLQIKPKGYKITDFRTIEWLFNDWKPMEDISITIWKK